MAAVSVALVVLTAIGACSGDNEADEPVSSTTENNGPGETTSDDDAERQAVIEAYLASGEARIEASAPPEADPDSDAIAATHTGPMLERSQEVLRGLQANGWAIRYPADSQRRSEAESVDFEEPDVAVLEVCTVDDGERIVVSTGEVLSSGPVTIADRAAMQRVDGRWLLAEREEIDRWEGVAGCAEGW